jgi:hypothetical protein
MTERPADNPQPSRHAAKGWGLFALRWGIAVVGIWYVIVNISWRDQVVLLNQQNLPVEARLAEPAEEGSETVTILDPDSGNPRTVGREQLVNEVSDADAGPVRVVADDGTELRATVLALDLNDSLEAAQRLLIKDPETGSGRWVPAGRVVGGYGVTVPYPRIQPGLRHMLHQADPVFLWAAVLIFPLTFLITGLRWNALLVALGIHLGLARAFMINMVGAFYNTFMPGSTGGDVLKAYYAAKHTDLRTRAVMSVIVDRAIGLVALIILGGTMAAYQWDEPACRQVAIASAAIMMLVAVGLVVFYVPILRRATGLNFILRKLPMQRQVLKAVETMEIYRRRPWLVLAALVMTFPVHITVIVSAMFAGIALGLTDLETFKPIHPLYYWVVVPVVVLAGALPISPQGAGVMEFFAIVLTRRQGATVAQAFALTMSIRLVQILWNLVGGIFVLRGGFHAPTQREQETLETDLAAGTTPPDDPEPSQRDQAAPNAATVPSLNPEP